jgi:hypothetical protein
MREFLTVAALLVTIAPNPLRAMNLTPSIAFSTSFCDASHMMGCSSFVLAQARPPIVRVAPRPVRLPIMSIVTTTVQAGCESIRRMGALMRTVIRDVWVRLR